MDARAVGAEKVRPLSARSVDRGERAMEIWYRHVLREAAWVKQGKRCKYCRTKIGLWEVTADHITPRDGGGETVPENIAAACIWCNKAKGSLPLTEFWRRLKVRPRRGDRVELLIAHIRWRLELRTQKACKRICRYVGIRYEE
jgi:hypothetical protein